MIGGKKPRGYTIIEVMIFLAVTGLLMISALGVFRGQQARTQFTQALRETDQRIRTIINEVGSGYFPSAANFRCVAGSDGPDILSNSSSAEQGTNSDCIFVGKLIQFGSPTTGCLSGGDTANCRNYIVYSLAGLRQANGKTVTSLSDAKPIAVDPQLTEEFTIPYGMNIFKVVLANESGSQPVCDTGAIGAIGFYQSFGGSGGSGNLLSGSQSTQLYAICGTELGQPKDQVKSAAHNTSSYSQTINPPGGVLICFGTVGDRTAAILVGGSGRQLASDVMIDGSVPAGYGCREDGS